MQGLNEGVIVAAKACVDGEDDPPQTITSRIEGIAGPGQEDPGAKVASKTVRFMIFLLFTQIVQTVMSFDGGATSAVYDTLDKDMPGQWNSFELGVLGSIDNIGAVVTSILWGRVLQLVDNKLVNIVGISLCAVSTFIFGFVPNKYCMLAMKFLMGATQCLQGVWATVWTVNMAPPEYKTSWLGAGALSAGIGSGIGTAVAGFGTANGLQYGFAFYIEAAGLAVCLLATLPFKSAWLVTTIPQDPAPEQTPSSSVAPVTAAGDTSARISGAEREDHSSWHMMRKLIKDRVFLWTSVAISLNMLVQNGVNFFWIRLFVDVFRINKNYVTIALIVVCGLGGGVGLGVGPAYIDRGGGYSTPQGVQNTLKAIRLFSSIAGLAGAFGCICLYGKIMYLQWGYTATWEDPWLWLIFLCIFFVWASLNGCMPGLCGVNVEVVPESMRTFATGFEMTFRNIVGKVVATIAPSILMEIIAYLTAGNSLTSEIQLAWGMGFILFACLVQVLTIHYAFKASIKALKTKQDDALVQLREALNTEDVDGLEKALKYAKLVDLQNRTDCSGVLHVANQVLFDNQALFSNAVLKQSVSYALLDGKSQVERLTELSDEVRKLGKLNEELRKENEELKRLVDGRYQPGVEREHSLACL